MKTKIFATAASVVALSACLFGLAGCGGTSPDVTDIQGEWKIEDSSPTVTAVFTDTQWKLVSSTYNYTLDTNAHTMTFKESDNEDMQGTANYEFSDDRQTLTLVQQGDDGKTQTTVFDKVSSDTSAEPTVDGKTAD